MRSCVYEGSVHHARYEPCHHAFRVPLFLVYLDLDEVSEVCERNRGWSDQHFAPTQFRRSDYLGDPELELAEAVRRKVASSVGTRPTGPIRLLTQLRYWGFVFNPVSFYYCFAEDGVSVEWIVAEVTNIPWRERHAYVVPFADGSAQLEKEFYVSPYLPMKLDYQWRFGVPGEHLDFSMRCVRQGQPVFDASLSLARRPIAGATRCGIWLRHPWMSVRTVASIYWQAFRLRRKGVPMYPHESAVVSR